MDRLQIRLAALSMVIDMRKSMIADDKLDLADTMEYAQTFNDFLLEDITLFEAEKEAAESEGEVIPVDFSKGEVIDEVTPEED